MSVFTNTFQTLLKHHAVLMEPVLIGFLYRHSVALKSTLYIFLRKYHLFDTNSPIYFCAGVSLNIHSFIHSFIISFIHSTVYYYFLFILVGTK